MLILNNIGNHTVIIERVDIYFCKQKIGNYDILRSYGYSDNAIISPHKGVKIILNIDCLNSKINGKPRKYSNKKYKLIAVVSTTNNNTYKSKCRCCYTDSCDLSFKYGFASK